MKVGRSRPRVIQSSSAFLSSFILHPSSLLSYRASFSYRFLRLMPSMPRRFRLVALRRVERLVIYSASISASVGGRSRRSFAVRRRLNRLGQIRRLDALAASRRSRRAP